SRKRTTRMRAARTILRGTCAAVASAPNARREIKGGEAMHPRARRIATWALKAALTYVFVSAGVLKLMGVRIFVQEFHRFGYPDWFRLLIGAVEVAGGLLLLPSRTAPFARAVLAIVMVGAAVSHLIHHEIVMAGLPLMLLLLLAALGGKSGGWVTPASP